MTARMQAHRITASRIGEIDLTVLSSSHLAAASHDLLQPLNAARLLISTLRERPLPQGCLRQLQRAGAVPADWPDRPGCPRRPP